MPENVLKGIISIIAPGAVSTFNQVSAAAKKTEAAIYNITPAANKTNNALKLPDLSKGIEGFRILGQTTELTGSKLGALNGVTNSTAVSMSQIAPASNLASSALKNFAGIISALAVTALVSGLIDLAKKLFDGANAFDRVSSSARLFDNYIRDLKEDLQDFKDELEFEGKLDKLALKLQGLTGSKLKLAEQFVDIKNGSADIGELNKRIEELSEKNKKLVSDRANLEKAFQGAGAGASDLSKELVKVGGDIEKLSDAQIKNLSKVDKELLREYRTTNEEIKKLSRERQQAVRDVFLKIGEVPLLVSENDNKAVRVPKIVIKPDKIEVEQGRGLVMEIPNITARVKKITLELLEKTPKDVQEKMQDVIQKGLEKLVTKPDLSAGRFSNSEKLKALQDEEIRKFKNLQVIGEGIAGVMSSAFDGLYDSISRGTNAIKGFFTGMAQGLGQVIKKLAEAAAISGILSLLGLGSFKDLFSGALGLIPKRAAGGPVSAGRLYEVNENGREFFRPNTGGQIIPLGGGSSGGISGGGVSVHITGSFSQKGTDMVAVIDLVRQSNLRLT